MTIGKRNVRFNFRLMLIQSSIVNRMVTAMFCCLAVVVGTSCSSTKTTSFSDSQSHAIVPVQSMVVVMVDDRGFLRTSVENNMTGCLKKHGVEAFSSYTKVNLKNVQGDKDAARQALSVFGAQAVLVSRLSDRVEVGRPPEFVSDVSHWEEAWGGPETRSNFSSSPWGGEVKVTVHVESKLYDLSDASLMWVSYTETTLKEFTDDLGRIRLVSQKIVDQLAKDGMIK